MYLGLVQTVSLAGNDARANEDRVGMVGSSAWVIDGATDLAEPGLMGEGSGSAWLAAAANAAFTRRCDSTEDSDLRSMVREVYVDVGAAYLAQRKRLPVSAWELPSGAFLAVNVKGAHIEIAWVADCACLMIVGETVHRIGPGRSRQERASASLAQRTGLNSMLDALRLQREHPERQAMTVHPESYRHVRFETMPCERGAELILMSDGFSALIDEYEMQESEFVAQLHSAGLIGLGAALRTIETADPGRSRFPRIKQKDDASAIWLRLA
jgi:hypothetical protein